MHSSRGVPHRARGRLKFVSATTAHHKQVLANLHDSQRRIMEISGEPPFRPGTAALLDGECIGIAGISEVWPGRAICWAFFTPKAGRHMVEITRAAARGLSGSHRTYRRIEMTTPADFALGFRWAYLLGFACEADRIREFYPGVDIALFARIDA